MDIDWSYIGSIAGGGGLAAAFVRLIIGRSLTRLDSIVDKLANIEVRLAAIDVHIQDTSDMKDDIINMAKQLVALETRIDTIDKSGCYARSCERNSPRM